MASGKYGEVTDGYEDEIPLDSNVTSSLLWSKQGRNKANALLDHSNKAENDVLAEEWKNKAGLNARPTKLCDDFVEDFVLICRVALLRNRDSDLYDAFDIIRTKFMGGWGFTPEQLIKLDAEIETEFQKERMRGLRTIRT